ncbi:hypothetical protein D3C81_610460 [compost metagenome]
MASGAESLQLLNQLVAAGNSLFLSDEDFVTINGITKPTLKKIYADFLSSISTYPSVAEGLTDTNGSGTNNRFFSVPGVDGDYEVRYRNDSGVALEVGRVASADTVFGIYEQTLELDYTLRTASRNTTSRNLLDLLLVADGQRLNAVDGTLFASAAYFTSGYIPVTPGVEYRCSYADRISFYNSSKTFISTTTSSLTATAPAGAAYSRSSYALTGKSASMFAESSKYPAQFEAYSSTVVVTDLHMDPAATTAAVSGLAPGQTAFIARQSANLFNKATVTLGSRVNSANGILLNDYALGGASDWIPVVPGTTYTQTEGNTFAEYDVNRVFVRGYATGTVQFTTAANTRYVRVTVRSAIMSSYMLVQGTALPGVYQPYDWYSQASNVIPADGKNARWAGKKWNVMGDSITADAASYWRTIASNLRFAEARNYGIGGTSIAYRDAPPGAPDPTLYTEKWMAKRFVDMPLDADLITIAGGTNDFLQVPLGSYAVRDDATVYGAMRTMCEGMTSRWPTATLGAILPFHRYNSQSAFNPYTFMALRDAMLEVYAAYGIPVYDSALRCPIRFWNTAQSDVWSRPGATTGLPDGLHPNEAGHSAVVPSVQDWILSL